MAIALKLKFQFDSECPLYQQKSWGCHGFDMVCWA